MPKTEVNENTSSQITVEATVESKVNGRILSSPKLELQPLDSLVSQSVERLSTYAEDYEIGSSDLDESVQLASIDGSLLSISCPHSEMTKANVLKSDDQFKPKESKEITEAKRIDTAISLN